MKGVAPVKQANIPSAIPFPLNLRWPIALWNGVFTETEPYVAKPAQDAVWNRGAYLVQGAGHCGSCHTPRGLAFDEKALDESATPYLAGALLDGWYAPSLRDDHNTGLGRWSEPEIVQFLKTGRNKHAVVYGSMTEAFNNSTQFMSDDDLTAIARYLKSLPGDRQRDGQPWQYQAASATERLDAPGAHTYVTRCASCHGLDGKGQSEWMPPLAGATSALAKESASAINITLNGSQRVVAAGVPDAYRMPAFREQLSDQEIAEVLTFMRSSWAIRAVPLKRRPSTSCVNVPIRPAAARSSCKCVRGTFDGKHRLAGPAHRAGLARHRRAGVARHGGAHVGSSPRPTGR